LKVLIIRFSSIGDIIVTTPIIRCVKLQLHAEVHVLTKEKFAAVLSHNPYIDKLLLFEKNTAEISSEKYDAVLDLQKNRQSYLLCKKIDAPRFSFDKLNTKKWIYVNFKINSLPPIHLVDRYFDGMKQLRIIDDGQGLDYFYDKEAVSSSPVASMIKPFQNHYAILVLGAAHATKRIPTSLAIKIIENNKLPVVLLGGKDVETEAQEIEKRSSIKVLNLTGKSTLDESAYVIEQSANVITGDTGLMHIAAALQKPIVLYWGNTTPSFGMYPYYGSLSQVTYISKEVLHLSCRPCSKLGHTTCPRGHFKCMLQQTT
jgi:ADP-heptose:LPS heptosyltransferase